MTEDRQRTARAAHPGRPGAAHAGTALLLIACALIVACRDSATGTERARGVPAARLATLSRGINLSHWFAQSHDYSPRRLRSYNTAQDATLIKTMGFRHVRFPFNDATVVSPEAPTVLDTERIKLFDEALDLLLAEGLAVILDFHPEEDYKKALAHDDAAVEDLVGMWRALAAHVASRDPARVFMEVMNEPVMEDPARWNSIQKKVLTAMREAAPYHTLIACGPQWSSVDRLEFIEIVADRNVVYSFHCYEPFFFTHQGATWAGQSVLDLTNLPYPSTPAAVAGILDSLPNEKARENAAYYGRSYWNCKKMDELIAQAAAWGRANRVPVTCSEFGVYRKHAPAASRLRCLRDVRRACEKYGIGWCMWDYAGGFGVATGSPGGRVADRATLRALGMAPARPE